MADYQAIGAVTETLKTLLEDRMATADPALPASRRVRVTTIPPDQRPDQQQGYRLNLFLYETLQSPYLRNQEIPGRGGSGYGIPPLSLELRYLLTGYGTRDTDHAIAQVVLGDAMRVLHDTPLLTESLTRRRGALAGQPVLDPGLLKEFERLKLTVADHRLEDIVRLWPSLQTPYRLSVALSVSVVQIESERDRTFPKPVREPVIIPVPFKAPYVEAVEPERLGIGQSLTLRGVNLGGQNVTVALGTLPIAVSPPGDREIALTLPDDPSLQPGVVPVQVTVAAQDLPQTGFQSNRAAFLLVPRITGAAVAGGVLTVDGLRVYHPDMPVRVLVGAASYTSDQFAAATPAQVQVPLGALPPGTYSVRVRVGTTESLDPVSITV